MRIPVDYPYAMKLPQQLPWDAAETIACCRIQGRFRLLGDDEEPLCRSMRSESEVYRFTCNSSFDGNAVVRIGRQGGEIMLRWVYRGFSLPVTDRTPRIVPLTRADWDRLQEALRGAGTTSFGPSADGARATRLCVISAACSSNWRDHPWHGSRFSSTPIEEKGAVATPIRDTTGTLVAA